MAGAGKIEWLDASGAPAWEKKISEEASRAQSRFHTKKLRGEEDAIICVLAPLFDRRKGPRLAREARKA